MPNITSRRAAAAALLIGAGLVQAPEARAGGVPTNLPIGENLPDTHFRLTGPTDVAEFKLNATAGKDLFVGLQTWYELRMEILDPNGKLLKTFDANGEEDFPVEEGVELHPLVSGSYKVRVAGQPGGYVKYPYEDPTVWAYPDCRGGPATKCAIAPGKTAAATFAGSNDDDAYVVKAPAGKRYTATLHVDSPYPYSAHFNLVDGQGEVLASQDTGLGPARRNTATLKFVLPGSGGPFILQARPAPNPSHNLRSRFTVSLAQQ
jgi:hypothetical protein